jgi:protein involved in polysaccharide export with SLBB domain
LARRSNFSLPRFVFLPLIALLSSCLLACAGPVRSVVPPPDQFVMQPWSLITSGVYQAVAVGDLNGDQHPDIAAGSSVPGGVALWYGDGRGGWSPPVFLPTKGDVRSLAVADFDMDGRPDLAVSIKGEFTGIQIWLNLGKGKWEKGQPPVDSGEFNGIRAADVNGDGNPDLIAAASEADGPGGIKVWLGDGKGGWLAEVGPNTQGEYSDVVVADFNEDGHLDVAASGRGLHGALRVWLGDGAGGWSELEPLEEGSFYGLSTGDLNRDRHLDLFAGTYRNGIRIYLGDGRGGFVGLKPPVERGTFWKVVCGDVDGEGVQEIVASRLDGNGIQVWKGVEGGFSVVPAFYESPFTCYDLALADLNGDGRQDLVAGSNGGGVEIWTSQGRDVPKISITDTFLGTLPEQEVIPVSPPENKVFVEKDGQAHYRVGPGDVLEISLWNGLKVDKYTVPVRSDGKISFAYFEDLTVSGLTVPQVDDVITETLGKFVRHPQVDVMVKEFNSKAVTVLGEINIIGNRVSGPGSYTLKGRTTLLKALSMAGGPTEKANLRQVSVRRDSGEIFTLNLYKTITQGDSSQNLVLDDGDTVVVPSLAEGRRVFVLGEVNSPGIYPIRNKLSVVEAVSMAGGLKETAVLGSARIVRGDLRKPEVIACNLKGFLDRGDMSQNISLKDGDVLYIPRNTLGNISDFLREISPILEFIIDPARVYRAYD